MFPVVLNVTQTWQIELGVTIDEDEWEYIWNHARQLQFKMNTIFHK